MVGRIVPLAKATSLTVRLSSSGPCNMVSIATEKRARSLSPWARQPVHPVGVDLAAGGKNSRKILPFEPSHPGPVDVKEAIAARLDHEQKQHQNHGKEQDAMRNRGAPH